MTDPNLSYGLPKASPITEATPRLPGINTMAQLAIVFAVLLALSPAAVVFGHLALHQIKHYPQDGRGLAIIGLVVGYLVTFCWITVIVVVRTA